MKTVARLRQLHSMMAPVMLLPLLITLFTGMGFQIAVSLDQASDFLWLMEWHRGNFGAINLEMIYPFLNALGLLTLVITGMVMWVQINQRKQKRRSS